MLLISKGRKVYTLMAIVIAGIIGGVVVGVIGGAAASYEDHSDYSDHSDYNDVAERERARERAEASRREQEEAERREAKRELTSVIRRNVNSFHARTGIMPDPVITASKCKFQSFEEDMHPMDGSVQQTIQNDLDGEDRARIKNAEKHLQEIDKVLLAINEKILNNK